jgi:cell division protein FtsB
MKKKLKLHLTPMQERMFIRIVIFLVTVAFAWILFVPNVGIVSYFQKIARVRTLEEKTVQLEKSNTSLSTEIERLKNDPAYLEDVARREQGLLKKNEYIYDFSQQKKQE